MIKDWTTSLHSGLARLHRMNAPVICVVQGDAAGGSVALAASADILIAADTARFSAAFSMIGFTCDSSSTVSLSNRMGLSRARRYLMMSETLSGEAALTAGLVDFSVPAAELSATAENIARKLAAGPTLAYGAIKQTMMSARTDGFETQLENEAQALARISATDDAWEGLNAFVEKRKPAFRGK